MKTVITTRAARAVVGAALGLALMASPGHAAPAGGSPSSSGSAQVSSASAAAKAASAHRRTPAAKRARTGTVRVLKVSDSRPAVGHRVTLTGRTHKARRTVVLQRRTVATKTSRTSRWVTVASTRAKASGSFRFTVGVADASARQYRVLASSKAKRRAHAKARASRALTVRPRVSAPAPTRRPTSPVTPGTSTAPSTSTLADQVADAVDRRVRDLRAANGRHAADHNACLSRWAAGFAAQMSRNNLLAHSVSSEWEGSILDSVDACADEAPAVVRQEAIARVAGDDPAAVADQVLAEMLAHWAHEEVLLEDFGTTRAMEVGVAPHPVHGWYVVVVLAAS